MDRCAIGGVTLEYELVGTGEPVLMIPGSLLTGSFRPLMTESHLAQRCQLIGYHRRGQGGSSTAEPPVSVDDQAVDAAGLLAGLGLRRAHVVGYSYGGLIALQLAVHTPELVGSLVLIEPNLLGVPSAAAFNAEIRPAVAAYRAGDPAEAVARFLAVVAGRPWPECARLIDERLPGAIAQAVGDAATFFTIEVPALASWGFDAQMANRIRCPVLSVVGTESHALFREGRDLLRGSFPGLEELDVPDAGHLLPLQNPTGLAAGLARFFTRHPLPPPG